MAIMHLWPDLYFQIDNAVFDFGAYHVMELSWQLLLVCSQYQLTLLLPILLGYHSFSKKAFSEKLTFHTPWYTHMYTDMSAYRSKRDTHMCAYRSNHDTHLYVRIGVTVVLMCVCIGGTDRHIFARIGVTVIHTCAYRSNRDTNVCVSE